MDSSLAGIFKKFSGGKSEMDGKSFVKVVKDSGLLDKKLTATDVDLIFAKVKGTSAVRTILLGQFEKGLSLMAEKKGISYQKIVENILQSGGPTFSGTKVEAVRFHDDKSLYTGVHANGGPSTIDHNISDISQICDRTAADKRGVKK